MTTATVRQNVVFDRDEFADRVRFKLTREMQFSVLPRIGETVELPDGFWEVTEVCHMLSGQCEVVLETQALLSMDGTEKDTFEGYGWTVLKCV